MKIKLITRPRLARLVCVLLCVAMLAGCSLSGGKVKLDPGKPVTISVWHYYNGAILNAFESLIQDFNDTVGREQGVIVEIYGHGNVGELEKAVLASASKEIGSMDMPNIFASYADTAYEAEKLGLLANLGDYFTADELNAYIPSYIEEGKIGLGGELRIFPVAKSTEIMMINETDWQAFADDLGLTYGDLATMEGVVRVSELYYEWSDVLTPNIEGDGKSFFGRDSMANLFIIAFREFDIEIFEVTNGEAKINVDENVMRKIWDNYYIPYLNGYFSSYGKFRSDDAKVGDLLAYVGSTSSATYFPTEVTTGGRVYPVEAAILPVPHFEGAERALVQQGAGMVVTKSDAQHEYASALFLKWFTDTQKNIEFSSLSGYMPVKKDALDYDVIKAQIDSSGITLNPKTDATLKVAIDEINTSTLYTNKAFTGGVAARAVLENSLQSKAASDREAVLELIESGTPRRDAVAQFDTNDNFNAWLADITAQLNDTVGQG